MEYEDERKRPQDRTPRMLVKGGPIKDQTIEVGVDPNERLNEMQQARGHYVPFEVCGGAYWQWIEEGEERGNL